MRQGKLKDGKMQIEFQEAANKLIKVYRTWQDDVDESCSSTITEQKFSKFYCPGHYKAANLD